MICVPLRCLLRCLLLRYLLHAVFPTQHPLSHPEWPLDLAVMSAGFRVCMEKGCMVDFRPLLSGMSLLQFYPGLRLQQVNAGGCKAYWMRLRHGEWLPQQCAVKLYAIHIGSSTQLTTRQCNSAPTGQHCRDCSLHAVVTPYGWCVCCAMMTILRWQCSDACLYQQPSEGARAHCVLPFTASDVPAPHLCGNASQSCAASAVLAGCRQAGGRGAGGALLRPR